MEGRARKGEGEGKGKRGLHRPEMKAANGGRWRIGEDKEIE